MTIEEKLDLIKSVGEEVIGLDEIEKKLREGKQLIAYDGFEPSGRIHIAQGIVRAINVQKMVKAGIHFKMFVADWHAYANNKMGGDLEKIHTVGEYFIEVWKAAGLDIGNDVEFIWASDLVKDTDYWAKVLQISKEATLKRVIRCSQIMGRNESDTLSAAQIIYPVMQATDIFYLQADIAQLGMDQRKVNMLARQIADEMGWPKPAAIHHHMLMSLQPPTNIMNDAQMNKLDKTVEMKMSKSKPESAIFMTDTKEEVYEKIKKAYCPPQQAENNPILEYFKYIVFAKYPVVELSREEKFGGNLLFTSYPELEKAYVHGEIYPLDLKENLSRYLNAMIEPVREHFENNKEAKKLKEEVESFAITR